jgi:hypothetical protein
MVGQLLVVVTQDCIEPDMKKRISKGLEDDLDWRHRLTPILCLAELGMIAFPKTLSGKVDRRRLTELVQSHCNAHYTLGVNIVPKVAELIGRPKEEVPLDGLVSENMNSIDLLRLLSFAETPQKITMELGMQSMGNLIKQLGLEPGPFESHATEEIEKPIGLTDLCKTKDSEEKLQSCIDKALEDFKFRQSGVEDIYPVDPRFARLFLQPNSQSFYSRSAFVTYGHSAEYVLTSLKNSLTSWPMFRTFHVELPTDDALESTIHVAVRAGEDLWKSLITHEQVQDLDAALSLLSTDGLGNLKPAQMLLATLVKVERPDCIVLIFQLNHSVFDALSMWNWIRHLDKNLRNGLDSFAHSFKQYADAYYRYRQNSTQCKEAVNYQARRLREVKNLKNSLWPVVRRNLTNEKNKVYLNRAMKIHEFPHIRELRKRNIRESILVKGAIALLNTLETASLIAMFTVIDAGRYWPSSGEISFTKGADGPTMSWDFDHITVDPKDTVEKFLRELHTKQKEMSSHIHAPWLQVLRSVGMDHVPFIKDAMTRQTYNWDVTMQLFSNDTKDFTELHYLHRVDMLDR